MQVRSFVSELQMLKFNMQLFPKWVFLKGIMPSNFRPNMWLVKEIHYRALQATPMKNHFNCVQICAVVPEFGAGGRGEAGHCNAQCQTD